MVIALIVYNQSIYEYGPVELTAPVFFMSILKVQTYIQRCQEADVTL